MPDIKMCTNFKCPLADKCYRVSCKPNDIVQSYQFFEPKFDYIKKEFYCQMLLKKLIK
jgi:hypothetical protein